MRLRYSFTIFLLKLSAGVKAKGGGMWATVSSEKPAGAGTRGIDCKSFWGEQGSQNYSTYYTIVVLIYEDCGKNNAKEMHKGS